MTSFVFLAGNWFNLSYDDDFSDMDRTATMIPKRLPLSIIKVHQVIKKNLPLIYQYFNSFFIVLDGKGYYSNSS